MKPAIEIMRERAAAAVRDLVARVPAGSIRAAFAGGSVGRDEVWSALHTGTLEIFSDIDLYVIVADDADAALVRRAAASVAAALPAGAAGVRFRRGVDVGVYRLDDLLAEPVRPGTVDLAETHLWLFGDRAVMVPLAKALSRPMERSEALYLLENRAWDLLEVAPEESAAKGAKVMLDVLAAHLIAEGRFVPTYQRRRAAVEAEPLRMASGAALAAFDAAERFRRGEARAIPAVDALAFLSEAWCVLGDAILFGGQRSPQPAEILSARCRRAHRVANYREFVQARRQFGVSKAAAILAGWRFTALSPHAALRTHAVVRGLIESRRVRPEDVAFHSRYVARLAARVAPQDMWLDWRVRVAMKASA